MSRVFIVLISILLLVSAFYLRRSINDYTYHVRNDFRSTTARVVGAETCTTGSSPVRMWDCAKLEFTIIENGRTAFFVDSSLRDVQKNAEYPIVYRSLSDLREEVISISDDADKSIEDYYGFWPAQRTGLFGWPLSTVKSITTALILLAMAGVIFTFKLRRVRLSAR